MAKIAQLSQNGVDIYPKTITSAIGVVGKHKLLTDFLTDIENEALSWNIKPIGSATSTGITYGLYYTPSGGTETLKSQFSIAQDIYLDEVKFCTTSGDVPSGIVIPQDQEFPAILLIWNTEQEEKTPIFVSVKDLVDVYTASESGITLNNGMFSLVKDPDTDNIISIGANGILVKLAALGDTYVSAAIDTTNKNQVNVSIANNVLTTSGEVENINTTGKLADAKAIKDFVNAKTVDLAITASGETGNNALVEAEVNAAVNNKHVIVSTTEKLQNAVASAETALQSIEKSGDYLTVSAKANNSQTVGLNVANDLTGTLTNKVADASAVKTYVDGKVNGLNANVSGTSGAVTVQVIEASGVVTNVNVTATTASVKNTVSDENALAKAKDVKEHIKDSIDALNADVTGQTTDTFIKVQVTEESGKTASVVVTDTVVAVSAATASNKGLAEASDVKGYVDGEITKSDIKASADITPTKGNDGTSLAINFAPAINGSDNLAVNNSKLYVWGVTATVEGSDTGSDAWPVAQNNG